MKRFIAYLLLMVTMTTMVGATKVYAAQIMDFQFTFLAHITGKSKFSVEKDTLYCDTKASTYYYCGGYDYNDYVEKGIIHSKVFNYKITMVEKRWFGKTYQGDFQPANGQFHEDEYNNLRKGTYTINVDTDEEMAPYNAQISGRGYFYD